MLHYAVRVSPFHRVSMGYLLLTLWNNPFENRKVHNRIIQMEAWYVLRTQQTVAEERVTNRMSLMPLPRFPKRRIVERISMGLVSSMLQLQQRHRSLGWLVIMILFPFVCRRVWGLP